MSYLKSGGERNVGKRKRFVRGLCGKGCTFYHTAAEAEQAGYRPPYPWEEMLNFLAGRCVKGIDVVKNGEYMRTAYFITAEGKHVYGWVRVGHKPQKNALAVTVSENLLPVRAVLGQQITVKAASTLAARIVEHYGTTIQTGIEGLTHIFPSPEDILDYTAKELLKLAESWRPWRSYATVNLWNSL